MGEILKRVLKDAGLDRPRRHEEIAGAWRDVAGPEIAAETAVRSFRKGVLTIEVGSAALHHELTTFQRKELLTALRTRLRDVFVEDLRFALR